MKIGGRLHIKLHLENPTNCNCLTSALVEVHDSSDLFHIRVIAAVECYLYGQHLNQCHWFIIPKTSWCLTMPYGSMSVPQSRQGLPGSIPQVVAVSFSQLILPLLEEKHTFWSYSKQHKAIDSINNILCSPWLDPATIQTWHDQYSSYSICLPCTHEERVWKGRGG